MRLKYHKDFMRRMLALFAFVNLFAGRASQQTSVWGGFGVAGPAVLGALGFLQLRTYRREQRDERGRG